MKFLVAFILSFPFIKICLCQTYDTIVIYDYFKAGDSWKIKLSNNNIFSLYLNTIGKNQLITNGKFETHDNTIQFHNDIPKSKLQNLADDSLFKFTNILHILIGDKFQKLQNLLLPINYYNPKYGDSTYMPSGIYAKYYRGLGFVTYVIELKDNGEYIFSERGCINRGNEEGTWTINNDIITFKTKDQKSSMLEWFTNGKNMYLIQGHLVGKKINKTAIDNKSVVTETYYYFSKDFEYIDH